jgi:hypothetical protein
MANNAAAKRKSPSRRLDDEASADQQFIGFAAQSNCQISPFACRAPVSGRAPVPASLVRRLRDCMRILQQRRIGLVARTWMGGRCPTPAPFSRD